MAKTLTELQRDLYDGFNLAMAKAKQDYSYDNNPSHQAGAQALIAAGSIATAIVAVERQIGEKDKASLKL